MSHQRHRPPTQVTFDPVFRVVLALRVAEERSERKPKRPDISKEARYGTGTYIQYKLLQADQRLRQLYELQKRQPSDGKPKTSSGRSWDLRPAS